MYGHVGDREALLVHSLLGSSLWPDMGRQRKGRESKRGGRQVAYVCKAGCELSKGEERREHSRGRAESVSVIDVPPACGE